MDSPARRGARSDRIAALVVIAGSILYVREATTFRPFLRTEPLGPATFPLLIGALMTVLGVVLFAGTFRAGRGLSPGAPRDEPAGVRRAAALWGLLLAYALLFVPAGFAASTGVFIFLAQRLLGVRPWWRAAALAALLTALAWYGFTAIGVRLPPGDWLR